MRRAISILLLLAIAAVAAIQLLATEGGEEELLAVSMVQLMTNPATYVGRRIQVVGYLGIDGKLYLTKDHADARDAMSSVAVSDTDDGEIDSAGCDGYYVRLRGRFGEIDGRSPIIASIEEVFHPTRGKQCWARKE